jgi:hypothetical protein
VLSRHRGIACGRGSSPGGGVQFQLLLRLLSVFVSSTRTSTSCFETKAALEWFVLWRSGFESRLGGRQSSHISHGIPQDRLRNGEQCLKIGHCRLFPRRLQFIIHEIISSLVMVSSQQLPTAPVTGSVTLRKCQEKCACVLLAHEKLKCNDDDDYDDT